MNTVRHGIIRITLAELPSPLMNQLNYLKKPSRCREFSQMVWSKLTRGIIHRDPLYMNVTRELDWYCIHRYFTSPSPTSEKFSLFSPSPACIPNIPHPPPAHLRLSSERNDACYICPFPWNEAGND